MPGTPGVYSTVPPQHLYIHVPFCARRCSYCDFSIAVRKTVPVDTYLDALRAELWLENTGVGAERHLFAEAWRDDRVPEPRPRYSFDTVYIGGGTPSRLGGTGIAEVVSLIREVHTITPGAEVTVEANPDDITEATLDAWVAAGVNRLSIGVQTFSDTALAWMHRTHTAEQSVTAVKRARAAGIDNLSLDLIFALPSDVARSWRHDVDRVLELSPAHVSLYGLTIEPFTPLARWTAAGLTETAADDRYAEEFLYAHSAATDAGYVHYEVSNFAKPGCESRHNSAYWSGAAYMGVGPSAHSFDGETRRWNVAPYAEWAASLAAGQVVMAGSELLTAGNRAAEKAYLGLRTNRGLPISGTDVATADRWVKRGWACLDGATVRLTAEGWLRLDSLVAGLTCI